mmetsp:Transcript_63970/g.177488  ORF Transcript_63970/g.177488 Transcript_63970/m.177488 type:complete len:245 (-) Transcript_63970:41-775(-)
MSLAQLLSLGHVDLPPRSRAARPSPDVVVSMTEEQLDIVRTFEEERQQEWAERRTLARAKARYEERKELEIASELAHAAVFDGELLERVQRKRLRGGRSGSSSCSGSGNSSGSSSSDSGSGSGSGSSSSSCCSASSGFAVSSPGSSALASSADTSGRPPASQSAPFRAHSHEVAAAEEWSHIGTMVQSSRSPPRLRELGQGAGRQPAQAEGCGEEAEGGCPPQDLTQLPPEQRDESRSPVCCEE